MFIITIKQQSASTDTQANCANTIWKLPS